jgi:hypothetical protein
MITIRRASDIAAQGEHHVSLEPLIFTQRCILNSMSARPCELAFIALMPSWLT